MTNIYIYHHLGLGDHINCNGLVRTLLKNKVKSNGNLYLLTKTQYNEMISFMYRDEPRIKIVTIKKMQVKNKRLIGLLNHFRVKITNLLRLVTNFIGQRQI